jgi:chromosome segregation ATPase
MSRRLRSIPICLALALTLASGCQREISGVYVAKFPDGVCRLQLVRTPDNRLSGQLETAVLKADGKIERNSVSVSGAINGTNVTMSASTLGIQVVTLSGTLDGNELTLTGGQPDTLVLRRSDLNGYQTEIKALNIKSEQITANAAAVARAAQAQEHFSSEINRILRQMQDFDANADLHLSRFPGAEERLHAITVKMEEYVNRERQLAEQSKADIARSQLGAALNEGLLATDQLHNSIQSLQQALESDVRPISVEATDLEQDCHHIPAITLRQGEADIAACDQLSRVDRPFREKLNAMTRGLAHLDDVYKRERNIQENLLQAAGRLQ